MKIPHPILVYASSLASSARTSWPSALLLVVANLIPFVGIFGLGWKASALIILYWAENVMLYFLALLKLAVICRGLRLIMIPLMIVAYGAFTLIHGAFVFSFPIDLEASFQAVPWERRVTVLTDLRWAIGALALSHAVSFAHHFIGRGEFRQSDPDTVAKAPFPRSLVLQITMGAGGVACILLQNSALLLAVLVAGKIALDLRAHLREHGFIPA